ncbi:MAG: HEPN-associated N-terminal domain-containing protein [Arenimonas sp.]
MGRVKDDWMEAEDRGWDEVDKFVCSDCVNEPELWRLAVGHETRAQCDYCLCEDKSVLPVSGIQEILYSVMGAYYAEPAQAGTPYDEGAYIVEPIDTDEVLGNLGFDPAPNLLEDILEADIIGAWVPAANSHWADSHEHQMKLGCWFNFAHIVKHQTRFHFQRMIGDHHFHEIEVADMLEVVAKELTPLVRSVETGTRVYRARHLTDAEIDAIDGKMMGAPPQEHTTAGRMNPAGIPYFYASHDAQTALQELGAPQIRKTPVVGAFVANRSLRVIDLTQLPIQPSIFAIDLKDTREKAMFLCGFVESITQPVRKDGQEHIDYVPSQVVCEYLAQAFFIEEGVPLDGLIFPSAIHTGGINLVIFPSGQWFEPHRFSSLDFVGIT